jgi:hypothetical protein
LLTAALFAGLAVFLIAAYQALPPAWTLETACRAVVVLGVWLLVAMNVRSAAAAVPIAWWPVAK